MNKKDIIFTILVTLFLISAIITLLGVTDVIHIDSFYLKGLFGSFILELSATLYGIVKKSDLLDNNDKENAQNIADNESDIITITANTIGIKPSEYVRIADESYDIEKTRFGSLTKYTKHSS